MSRSYVRQLSSWGGVLKERSATYRPEHPSDLPNLLSQISQESCLPYGCGRSYGDVCLTPSGGATILTTRMDRLLAFDSSNGTLVCESGVTLKTIQQTFLPRGYGLVTSPGTGMVTIGGAIANDVHGKNHDQVGSFGAHVVWIDLLLASGEVIRCSKDENAECFFATVGGLGLTGIITHVCLQLAPQTSVVRVTNESIAGITPFLDRLGEVRDLATYSVGWIDLSAKDQSFGRGILSVGEPHEEPLSRRPSQSIRHVPRWLPSAILNGKTICWHNAYHYRKLSKQKQQLESLMQFLYPLDRICNWNRLYGRKGFYQFQCVIPELGAKAGVMEVCQAVYDSRFSPYLSVIKTLGSEGTGLMSFAMRGYSLAMDFPNKRGTVQFLKELMQIVQHYQGRMYLAKDAVLQPEMFQAMYPDLLSFQKVLSNIDPHKRWQSALAKRLGVY